MAPTQEKNCMPALADSNGRLVWEKRREPRYRTHDPAYVEVVSKTALRALATVVDVSRSGLRLELQVPLPVHAHVEITIRPRGLVLFGEVRHCRAARGRYHAGVLIRGVVGNETAPTTAFTRA